MLKSYFEKKLLKFIKLFRFAQLNDIWIRKICVHKCIKTYHSLKSIEGHLCKHLFIKTDNKKVNNKDRIIKNV